MARDGDIALDRYIQRVKDIPTLDREVEHEFALRVRDHNDDVAVDRLVHANLRYVVAIAVTYRRYDVRLADLISEGNVGLVTAVRKFDPDKGTRFVTYAAYWIRAFVLNYVIKSWSLVGSGSGALRSKMFTSKSLTRKMPDRISTVLRSSSERLGFKSSSSVTKRPMGCVENAQVAQQRCM